MKWNLTAPDLPRKGFASYLGLIILFLSTAPIWIGALADETEPLGLSPSVWLWAGVATSIALVLGRSISAALGIWGAKMQEDRKKGLATYIGAGTTILAGLPLALKDLTDAAAPLNVDPDVWVKATAALGIATMVGGYLQSMVIGFNKWRDAPTA